MPASIDPCRHTAPVRAMLAVRRRPRVGTARGSTRGWRKRSQQDADRANGVLRASRRAQAGGVSRAGAGLDAARGPRRGYRSKSPFKDTPRSSAASTRALRVASEAPGAPRAPQAVNIASKMAASAERRHSTSEMHGWPRA